jgi:Cobalamin-independent synthase, Catalytic domain
MTLDQLSQLVRPAASGVGSLPGTDPGAAVRMVFDVFGDRPGTPFLPELPARGAGADVTGRTAALLVELFAEIQPSGWRLTDNPGRDHGRATGFLHHDLDSLEDHTQGYQGPFKVQALGPWTLAATLELRHGDRALSDPGACRDLTASLADGLAAHLAEIRGRMPGADLILQLDEPGLPGVLAGSVPTASGFGRLRVIDPLVAQTALTRVIETVGVPVIVHCCAPDVPFELLRRAGAAGIALDWSLLSGTQDEVLGALIEAGTMLFAGVVPSLEPAVPAGARSAREAERNGGGARSAVSVKSLMERLLELRRLGFPAERLAQSLVVTPSCGLAGASPAWARRALKLCLETADALREA